MLFASLLLALVFSVVSADEPRACATESLGSKLTKYKLTYGYYIKEDQLSAYVSVLPSTKCSNNDTLGLLVEACDYGKTPKVEVRDDKQFADITRIGDLIGRANVVVTVYCAVEPGPYQLPYVYEETPYSPNQSEYDDIKYPYL